MVLNTSRIIRDYVVPGFPGKRLRALALKMNFGNFLMPQGVARFRPFRALNVCRAVGHAGRRSRIRYALAYRLSGFQPFRVGHYNKVILQRSRPDGRKT